MADPASTFDPRELPTRQMGGRGEYMDVKWRLVWLRKEHPDATIDTEQLLHTPDQMATFKAVVAIPGGGRATGHGSETKGDFGDYFEKAETKAIGRALAALGYGTQFLPEDSDALAYSPGDRPTGQGQAPQAAPGASSPTPINRAQNQGGVNLAAVHAAFQGKVEGDAHKRAHALAEAVYGVPSMRDLRLEQAEQLRKALGECRSPQEGEALIALALRTNAATSDDELQQVATDIGLAGFGEARTELMRAAFRRSREAIRLMAEIG